MLIAGRYGVASERRSPLARAHSGGLARKLVRQLPVPLLVIPPDIDEQHICPNLGPLAGREQGPDISEDQDRDRERTP
jgi:hypothetical protein